MAYLDNTGVTRLATDLKAKLAEKEHEHSAADVTSGTLAVARGGTGLAASPSMLTNLGSTTADDVLKASPRPGVTGTLAIANGGTGATTAADAAANIVDGQAIEPASVAATGEVSAKAGTTTHKLTEKAEDTRADNLEASIAYVESVTAKTNHAVGDYFILGDVLMKATAAIATGEQITTSNATPATVQSQIDALRDSVSTTFSGTGSFSGMSGYVERCGKLCILKYVGDVSTTEGWQDIGTIPEGYRPAASYVDANGFQWGTRVDIGLRNTGTIQANLAAGTNQRVLIKALAYLCD